MGEVLNLNLDNTTNNESFSNTVNCTISSIEFDPEVDIISKYNSVVLGIPEAELPINLFVAPNPSSSLITIHKHDDLEVKQIKIYNAVGQLLFENGWTPTIELSSFSTGMLFVQFHTNKGIFYKRVLKN